MSHYLDDTLNISNSTVITVIANREINQPKLAFILRVLAIKFKVLPDWWIILIRKRTKKDIESLKRIVDIYNKEFSANLQVKFE